MPPLQRPVNSHTAPSALQPATTTDNLAVGDPRSFEETSELGQDARLGSHPPTTFRGLGIVETLCDACQHIGYGVPTSIQSQSSPLALQGRDIIGVAETGSGKTAAFVLPLLQTLLSSPQSFRTLIIAPTRELAQQIAHVVEALGSIIAVKCVLLIGGVDMVI
jgi:ATP-dependent RNA helicase DDX47/RRP3